MAVNHHGSIDANQVYVEDQLCSILHISRDQLIEYLKLGLRYYRRTQKEKYQIAGIEYLRFVERMSRTWEDDGNAA